MPTETIGQWNPDGKNSLICPSCYSVRLSASDKPYFSGILDEIDKSIRTTARTITQVKLKDKIRSQTTLLKAGLRSLNKAVCEMDISIWKSRNEMNPLDCIF